MLAKNNSVQQQPSRRTPLSLSTSMKPVKPNDKNDNSKKEPINNQKTENSKKDSQPEKKLSGDKKQSSTESKRSSSTSSSDSKKLEGTKINKNEDNKKSQNGVNGNGIKDKPNTPNANEVKIKTKPESSSNGSASKKDSQKPMEKKKDHVVVEVALKKDNQDKPTEKIKEIKNEENKNKSVEKNKEQTVDVSNTTKLDKGKSNEMKDEAKVVADKKKDDEKVDEEKNTTTKSPEKIVKETNIVEQGVTMDVLEFDEEEDLPLITLKTEETTVLKTPIKEKIDEDTPILENPLPEDLLEDVVMMEPLQFIEEPTSCNIFAVSTPAKTCSPKEAQNLFEIPSKLSPKSEVKPAKAPLTHTPDRKSCPRTFSSISGRRSIRPIGDYTFSGNLQIRESYRKINTELDFTSSSLNVTVGSEVPNNESFSFFSRSRKRDRSSPSLQSAMEVQSELSPKSPKRARIDIGMHGFFNAMASPITMLRARLARASVQSTPKKQIIEPVEQEIVENVSAIAVEAVDEDLTATEEQEQTFNPDSTVADTNEHCEEPAKCSQSPVIEKIDDIKIKETITATDSQAKKKCSIM